LRSRLFFEFDELPLNTTKVGENAGAQLESRWEQHHHARALSDRVRSGPLATPADPYPRLERFCRAGQLADSRCRLMRDFLELKNKYADRF